MSFYGQMPDSYNLVVNIAHPKVQALLAEIKEATGNSLDDLNQQVEALRKEQAAEKDSEAKLGEPATPEAGDPANTEANLGEDKQGSLRFVRVDSDVIENLIAKADKPEAKLGEADSDALRYTFEGLLPKSEKTNYVVSLENVSADALPVFLTQNEWMRRMK